VIALALEGDDVIARWRALIGPTKVSRVKFEQPDCLRHDYGISDTRNAFHGSDSLDNAFDELSIVFDAKIKMDRSIDAIVKDSVVTVPGLFVKTEQDGLQLIEQEVSKVSAEKSRAAAVNSNEMSLTKLAKLTFWEEFHQNGKNDWFLDHTQVFQILKEDVRLMPHLDESAPSKKLNIIDLGCGTSAVGSVLVAKFKNVNISLVDFSEAACLYQQNRIDTILSVYSKRSEGGDLLANNQSTIEINRQNVKSLNYANNNFHYMLDKGTMDAICRLPVEDVFQAMDEISRVMAPGGILLQFTEEPPEVRLDLWERWGRTVKRKVKIGNQEVDDKYVYRVTFE